jgi:hypothetical protein
LGSGERREPFLKDAAPRVPKALTSFVPGGDDHVLAAGDEIHGDLLSDVSQANDRGLHGNHSSPTPTAIVGGDIADHKPSKTKMAFSGLR